LGIGLQVPELAPMNAVESWTDTDVQVSIESLIARQPRSNAGQKKQEMISGFCFKFYS
jgi:hypothetical protein